MNNKTLQSVLQSHLKKDAPQAIAFIDKAGGFSQNGETVIAAIFNAAHKAGKSVSGILQILETEFERTWKLQDPVERGDPKVIGSVGIVNKAAVADICTTLGIPNLLATKTKTVEIPSSALVVKTAKSTYVVGAADANGKRTITKNGKDYPECTVVSLGEGQKMQFKYQPEVGDPQVATTTVVTSVASA